MKTIKIFTVLVVFPVFLGFSGWLNAEEADSNVSKSEDFRKRGKQRNEANPVHVGEEEIRMLRRLLELPPHRLRVLRKTIERMEEYSDEERELMKKKLALFRAEGPEERRRTLEHLKKRHDLLKLYLSKFRPEKRLTEAKKFYALSLQDKKKFLEDLNNTVEKGK